MSEYNIRLMSKYLKSELNVVIITPDPPADADADEFYASDKTFPVLWMMHGGYGTFADRFVHSKAPRYALERGMILVTPFAPNSDFSNQAEVGEGFMFEDFFIKELVPLVRRRFKGSSDPKDNLIAGDSMGCAASWRYGLAYPNIFGHIGALCNEPLDYSYMEEFRNMTNDEFREYAKNNKVRTAYGIDSGVLHAKELNMICRFDTVGDFLDSYENTLTRFDEAVENGTLPDVYLPGAFEKIWGAGLKNFKEHCEAIGAQNITFKLVDKPTHNAQFWDESLEMFLEHAGFHKL